MSESRPDSAAPESPAQRSSLGASMGLQTLALVALVSGVCSLADQMIWARALSVAIGSERLAADATLAGTFFGLSLGAWLAGRSLARGRAPWKILAIAELSAALWAPVGVLAATRGSGLLARALGPELAGSTSLGMVLGAAVLLLAPGTLALGASLAALSEGARRIEPEGGRGLVLAYGLHAMGGALAILTVVHLLLPRLGLSLSALVSSLLGFALATWAWRQAPPERTGQLAETAALEIATDQDPDPELLREAWVLILMAAGLGLLSTASQSHALRLLAQVGRGTLYTYAHLSVPWLIGGAAGALSYRFLGAWMRRGWPARSLSVGLALCAGSAMIAAPALRQAGDWLRVLDATTSFSTVVTVELWAAAATLFLPGFCVGLLSAHIFSLLRGAQLAKALAAEALGAALAPWILSAQMIPRLGFTDTWFALAWGYAGLLALFCWLRRFSNTWLLMNLGALFGLSLLTRGSLILVHPSPAYEARAQVESPHGFILVSELPRPADLDPKSAAATAVPERRLQVDQNFRMGGGASVGEQRAGHIPLLYHPRPERVLCLGLGTGATCGAARQHPSVTRIDAVELLPELPELLPHFSRVNSELHKAPNFHPIVADARRFLAAQGGPDGERWDVIIGDLFHPEREGADRLVSRQHFAAARQALAPGGVFVQWLPLYQLSQESLASVVAAFNEAFEQSDAVLGIFNVQTPTLALVGRGPDHQLNTWTDMRERARNLAFWPIALREPAELQVAHLLSRTQLETLAAGQAPADDEHLGPSLRAAREPIDADLGWRNLQRILALAPPVESLPPLLEAGEGALGLPDQRAALELYLEGEALYLFDATAQGAPPEERAARAVERWLEAFERAPSFSPAVARLYAIARQFPHLAEEIFEPMLTQNPSNQRAWVSYARALRQRGDVDAVSELQARATAALGQP